jgi:hypothetical protein
MADYRPAYEVTDLEGNRLLAAGTQLTRRVMEDLSSRKPGAIKTCRFMGSPKRKTKPVPH